MGKILKGNIRLMRELRDADPSSPEEFVQTFRELRKALPAQMEAEDAQAAREATGSSLGAASLSAENAPTVVPGGSASDLQGSTGRRRRGSRGGSAVSSALGLNV